MSSPYRHHYDTDLSNKEWKTIRNLFPKSFLKRKRKTSIRRTLDALFYLSDSGCKWKHLPKGDFPPKSTVNYYFIQWRNMGFFPLMNDVLVKLNRVRAGRDASPSAAICDAQSVLSALGGKDTGFDGGKKTKGRKRQIVVDVMGNLLAVHVHAANTSDKKGGLELFRTNKERLTTIKKIWADGGYAGMDGLKQILKVRHAVDLEIVKSLKSKVKNEYEASLMAPKSFSTQLLLFEPTEISSKPLISRRDEERGFKIVAWRWIVERTLGWLSQFRRLRVDYERNTKSAEAWCYLASIRMTLSRVT